ncbi:FAD/NAD(P)-binding domain-containing protein [Rhizopogon vinicolor AM-OR11-026]|uniref:FAD/NAD(P)-binding domain-containing protein n=1 Tax=Rhizopogon vinicolor AM-OR11-026 TaxID=1314800 RepID=A0A1B7MXW0_9AGAM|nr:FAD/NAD(P)-binding domain-containing protein [Rhizopogon vinicolor AM-OR11-026]
MGADECSFTARYARQLIRGNIARELHAFNESHGVTEPPVGGAHIDDPVGTDEHPLEGGTLDKCLPLDVTFCIIGAGAAGLYTAMILKELGIPFDILEASERVGGRMYTHRFSEAPNDYYDVGAMRWPDIPVMNKAFSLFEELHIPLIPYHMNGKNTPMMFNNILGPPVNPLEFDPYKFSVKNGSMVPDEHVAMGVQKIIQRACAPYFQLLKENVEEGFKKLMEVDNCSIREYMRTHMQLDYYTIQWMETSTAFSNLFDQAFSEFIILGLDFFDAEDTEWKCIDGGSAVVVSAMLDKIAPFTRIALNRAQSKVEVKLVGPSGQPSMRQYDTVFNTTPLSCSRNMDLVDADLHPAQRDALRCLRYETCCKVAIKFRTPWWIVQCGITEGGVALSDLPHHTMHDDPNKPAVLIASYAMGQDAQRIACLISQDSPIGESQLKELMLRDLARLHATSGITYDFLAAQYITHHAFNWSHNPLTSGSFALFGPGQFSHLYPYLVRPAADGRLHFAGEASSVHHAWVVGALESAQRAVILSLLRFGRQDLAKKVEERWGPVSELEWEGQGTAHVQAMLGRLAPERMTTLETIEGVLLECFAKRGQILECLEA